MTRLATLGLLIRFADAAWDDDDLGRLRSALDSRTPELVVSELDEALLRRATRQYRENPDATGWRATCRAQAAVVAHQMGGNDWPEKRLELQRLCHRQVIAYVRESEAASDD